MSNGGGGGRGGGGGSVTIPENVKKTIHSIREITGKQHSDEDIYSVLQDCSMDPDDTAQKLLYLDTFHEVKRKHDRRKGTRGRGARGGGGNYHRAGGGKIAATRRENGADCMTDRNASNTFHSMQKRNNSAAIPGTKDLTTTANGPSTLSNGSSILGHGPKLPATAGSTALAVKKLDASSLLPAASPSAPTQTSISVTLSKEGKSTSFPNGLPTPASSSGSVSSFSDPIAVPPSAPTQILISVMLSKEGKSTSFPIGLPTPASPSGSVSSFSDPIAVPSTTRNPGAVGTVKCEEGSQREGAEQNHIQGNKKVAPSKSKAAEQNQLSAYKDSLVVNSSTNDCHSSEELALPLKTVLSEDAQAKVSSQSLPEPTITNGHVKFPNHFRVPEALKSGFTFGSFDTNSGPGKEYSNYGSSFVSFNTNSGPGAKCSSGIDGDINSMHSVELAHPTNEIAMEPSSNDSGSTPMQVDHSDQPESPGHVLQKVSMSEGNVAPSADSSAVQPKQDGMLLLEGHQSSTVQIAPNYGFGNMPPMHATHLVPFTGHETQARDDSQLTGFVSENSMASATPSLTQPMQNSVATSPHPLFLRPPYPPNYLHYFNPYFFPPMHQFLGHNGLPQQPPTGNAYLTAAAPTAAGVKFPLPQFKRVTRAGSLTPIALPTLYGSYDSSPMGFNPGSAVTSGSSAGNDDLSASQLKERNIYTTGPLSEISPWIPPPGQDLSSLQLSSLYRLHPQGHHLTFSPPQAGLAAFPGIYPPVQTMAAPSAVNQLMQQSQTMPATVEPVVPPSGPYQQPQLTQMNWNSNYQAYETSINGPILKA